MAEVNTPNGMIIPTGRIEYRGSAKFECPGCGEVYENESQWIEITDNGQRLEVICQCPNPECGQFTTLKWGDVHSSEESSK